MMNASIQSSQSVDMPHNLSRAISCSAAFHNVLRRVNLVAPTDATILIRGETDTGKEVVASAIHMPSSRSRGPVVKVNWPVIPFGLLEIELSGHERRAVTGPEATTPEGSERLPHESHSERCQPAPRSAAELRLVPTYDVFYTNLLSAMRQGVAR